ncbi:MAG: zinc ribbon domain-containing protein [Theionarchaea archaeon]|nr:zinc ribbon domain-containing protein [Theionarchaea archaeon]
MAMMFCDYCGNALSTKWKYCPYCGKKIKGEPDIFDVLFRDGVTGFSIRITSANGEKPHTRMNRYGAVRVPVKEPEENEKVQFIPQKVLEPEGKAQMVGHHMLIRVKLPGVKEKDVDVRKLEESVEIKAYREHEAYFKQFQVPHDARIISKHMEGDELVVEVG